MNRADVGSSMMNRMMTGGIGAKSAPRIGIKSRRKHKIPNKNHPGKSNPIGDMMIVITSACPALHVTFDTT